MCNTFHALKVAFANEVGALCRTLSVDGASLMNQLVQDQKLNISPAYLRPGLAFGGSCLPKDLRMILHLARIKNMDLPLLRSILPSNDAHLRRSMDLIPDNGMRRVGLNGLAFKAGTDDLRESPIVLIAEYLIGKGYDVKIHDSAIETSRISGANREYIEKRIPHLYSRLAGSLDELIAHSEILLITRDGDAVMDRVCKLEKRPLVIDLSGRPLHARKTIPIQIASATVPGARPRVSNGPPPRPRARRKLSPVAFDGSDTPAQMRPDQRAHANKSNSQPIHKRA
jgi:GDP-mannose 6-dehydrogenase